MQTAQPCSYSQIHSKRDDANSYWKSVFEPLIAQGDTAVIQQNYYLKLNGVPGVLSCTVFPKMCSNLQSMLPSTLFRLSVIITNGIKDLMETVPSVPEKVLFYTLSITATIYLIDIYGATILSSEF